MSSFDLANPEHAYMFGFIQADGHLSEDSRNRGRLRVELSARDLALLLEFQRICPWPSSVTSRTRATNFADAHASVSWSVHAREFRTALKELGLPAGRKSTTVAPPVAPFAPRDYLRGLIDADGSVGLTGTGKPFVALTTASDALMRFFRDYAQDLTGARRTLNRNARDAVYNVLYSNEEAVTLARDLYYPGCLALPRKQAAALGVTAWLRPPGSRKVLRKVWTAEEDSALLAAARPEEAAALLDRSVSSCSMRRWRLLGPEKARVRFPRTPAT
ncbi:LAGLIDADG family homing endonuclease [Kitasatospora sp. NBC_00374]|uniref:LAGLIDADG family homing endonuclease n=1 Tax=Kitasatospora sp. NBC_00374 TaxID=2975964 RepID=UPI0030E49267